MDKIDFKKQDKPLYTGKVGRFDILTVPAMPFLMVEGDDGPAGEAFNNAIGALYALSYGLKFHSKKAHQKDYVVAPLEALWWADDMNTFVTREKTAWKWRAMIRQPDWFGDDEVEELRLGVIAKQAKMKTPKADADTLNAVRFEMFDEGTCVQILHMGAYDDEGPVLAKMHNTFIPENGLQMRGRHHEIYLNDPRRVAPEKLKTILRQPVVSTGAG